MYRHTVAAEPGRPLLESCLTIFLVELPLYTSLSAVLPRTAGVPVLGLSSKSLRHDHFFTKCSLLCNIFDDSLTDIPEDLTVKACARV